MVDVFGGSGSVKNRVGPQGPIGPRGLPGSIHDFCLWLPKTIIDNLQKFDESGCFFIENPSTDLEKSGKEVIKWISRSVTGWNLVAEKSSSDLIKLGDRYVLGFKKNRYVSNDIGVLEKFPGTSAFLCITFKVFGDGEHVLVSNYEDEDQDYYEIRVTSTEIILHIHSDDEILQHSCRDWTTLFVECNSDTSTTYFKYAEGIALGSRYDDTYFLDGQVSALEFYRVDQPSEVPEELKKIVIKNQRIHHNVL